MSAGAHVGRAGRLWPALAAAALVGLYAAPRLRGLTDSCLWFDELFGVHAARHDWGGLWRFVAADLIHPPLFYALLKIWAAAGGESLLWLRLFPALTSVAALVPFLLLARELRLPRAAAGLALLLAAANGYLIKYAQEVRMYGLLLLLSLFSLWLLARLLAARGAGPARRHAALFAANLLLAYTHYYGWLVVAGEAAFLLFAARRKLPRFLITAALVAACLAPWMVACAREAAAGGGLAQNIGWIERPGAKDLAGFFALLHAPFNFQRSSDEPAFSTAGALAGLLLVGLPVALLLLRALRRRRARDDDDEGDAVEIFWAGAGGGRRAVAFLAFFALFPVAAAALASYALPHSVWGARHLIVAAGPYMLLAGLALARLRLAWLKASALVLLGCWLVLAGALSLARRQPAPVWCAWGDLAASAAREETAGAARVFAFEDLVAYHVWFALDGGRGDGRFKVAVVKGVEGVHEDPAFFLPRRFEGVERAGAGALEGPRFWVAFRDRAWDESRPPLGLLRERGYRFERVFEAPARGQRAFFVLASRGGAE
ncbi:MAG TPA: hypothetical protein VD968_06810 [Pyrinomonadaceae bacterium]|nr:hypothetical protein [Pyrinomonadaceae bacterium]